MTTPVSISFKIEKADKTGRYVAGWLSVVEKDGKVVEDSQGDRMSMETLRAGVHKYMRGSRVIKKQHSGEQIGEMAEVIMIDDDFAKAHGITHGKRGAWGMAEITDPEIRKSVVAGDVTGWSMGGRGKRTPIAKSGFAPLVETDEGIEKAGLLLRGGSLKTRRALFARSRKNTASRVAGEKGASARGYRLGRAQNYLTRRLARQGHTFKR